MDKERARTQPWGTLMLGVWHRGRPATETSRNSQREEGNWKSGHHEAKRNKCLKDERGVLCTKQSEKANKISAEKEPGASVTRAPLRTLTRAVVANRT